MNRKKHIGLRKAATGLMVMMAFSILAGCGYHFKGMGLVAPEGVQTIAVPVLENKTAESGIETVFSGDLAYEFTRSKILEVVDKESADAVLSGSIESSVVDTISHTATYSSDERRVTITLKLVLKRSDGKVLWKDESMADSETFKVTDKLTTERNRRAAIEILSERLAEKIHNRILQDF